MISLRRIAAEVWRELTSGTARAALVTGLVLSGLVAASTLWEFGPGFFFTTTYVLFPLLACPLAAQRVASDRERGVTTVLATTPLGEAEYLTAKIAGLGTLLAIGFLATLPMAYAVTEPLAPGAFATAAPIVLVGLAVGLASLLVGLIVGYADVGTSRVSISAGFGLVMVWALLAFQRDPIVALADGGTERALLEALTRVSPATWSLQAQPSNYVGVVDGWGSLLLGLLALSLGLLVVLASLACGLQHLDGWLERSTPVAAGILVLGLALAGGSLAAIDAPDTTTSSEAPDDASDGSPGALDVSLRIQEAGSWGPGTPLTAELTVRGPPNATVNVTDVAFDAPGLSIEPRSAIPTSLALDETRATSGGEAYGVGRIDVELLATPHRIATLWRVDADLTLDGNETTLSTDVTAFAWSKPGGIVLLAAGAPPATAAGLAALAPRWSNRW
jgi:hypothetical protein